MSWNFPVIWLLVGMLLAMAELFTGGMVMLALASAAFLTAVVAMLHLSIPIQLLIMGVLSGVLVPFTIWRIRPLFSPRGIRYGTTGTGAEKGKTFFTEKRSFDNATVIRLNGDLYRIRIADSAEDDLEPATAVIFDHFDGTTAIVHLSPTNQTQYPNQEEKA